MDKQRPMSPRRKKIKQRGYEYTQPKPPASPKKKTAYYSQGGRVCSDYMGSATIIKTKG